MHAFLIVGNSTKESIEELSKKLSAKIINFPLNKIDDVRNLNELLKLSFSEPSLIVSENIDSAGEEALNAFLKNLEEPQENIYFALTTSSERKVLSTIVSRCQVIKLPITNFQFSNNEEIINFLNMSPSQKLMFFDKMKERDKAIEFIESLIFFLHDKRDLTNMEILLKTLTCLKANGNVNLHLTNLVTKYGNN